MFAQIEEIGSLVVGHDPMNVRALWEHLQKSLYFRYGPAVSGIEMACWDIIGQKLSAPVWQLLGGTLAPRLRAYANGWYSGPRDPKGFAESARDVVEKGYTALKFDPFGHAYKTISPSELRESLNLVEAVREAVGDNVDIMIEAHDRFTVPMAVHIGRELARFSPFWLEAPVMSTDSERHDRSGSEPTCPDCRRRTPRRGTRFLRAAPLPCYRYRATGSAAVWRHSGARRRRRGCQRVWGVDRATQCTKPFHDHGERPCRRCLPELPNPGDLR